MVRLISAIEKSVTGLTHQTEIFAGVFLQDHCEMNARLSVLLDRLHERSFPGERNIHDVGATFRMDAHTVASLHAESPDGNTLEPRGGAEIVFARTQVTHAPMHFHEMVWSERLGPLENAPGEVIDLPHLRFLRVGHCHDPQCKNLIDLGAITEVARAFRRNPRVIIENNWRGKHRVALAALLLSHQHRVSSHLLATAGRFDIFRRRIEQRKELAIVRR